MGVTVLMHEVKATCHGPGRTEGGKRAIANVLATEEPSPALGGGHGAGVGRPFMASVFAGHQEEGLLMVEVESSLPERGVMWPGGARFLVSSQWEAGLPRTLLKAPVVV